MRNLHSDHRASFKQVTELKKISTWCQCLRHLIIVNVENSKYVSLYFDYYSNFELSTLSIFSLRRNLSDNSLRFVIFYWLRFEYSYANTKMRVLANTGASVWMRNSLVHHFPKRSLNQYTYCKLSSCAIPMLGLVSRIEFLCAIQNMWVLCHILPEWLALPFNF